MVFKMNNRIDTVRNSRTKAVAYFAKYLTKRTSKKISFIFEGQECPSFYLPFIKQYHFTENDFFHAFVEGRDNVISFREIQHKNPTTKNDHILYFIDKDFIKPRINVKKLDIYITDRYSIENYCCEWNVISSLIQQTFGLNLLSEEDNDVLLDIKKIFTDCFENYLTLTHRVQEIIFICRHEKISCTLCDLKEFIDFKNNSQFIISKKINQDIEIFNKFKILNNNNEHYRIKNSKFRQNFSNLNKYTEWRGKYHIQFLTKFLDFLVFAREHGVTPFQKRNNTSTIIQTKNIISILSNHCSIPLSLKLFLESKFNNKP